MSVLCPEGHTSEATDYCDTCGAPIGAAPAGGSAPAPSGMPSAAGRLVPPGPPVVTPTVAGPSAAAAAATQTCPHCGEPNQADALFCEDCGYDFTTGAAPLGSEPVAGAEVAEEPVAEVAAGEPEGIDPQSTQGVTGDPQTDQPEADQPNGPLVEVEPLTEEPVAAEPVPEQLTAADPATEEPDPAEPVAEAPAAQSTATTRPAARHTPPSRHLADTWVVEMWVDADWYAVQDTTEACPSPGVPDVVPLTRTPALIGRPSSSLAARPEIDAGGDSAVSRRHAQLTSDGHRWWVEDLGSSNGTFVGTIGEPLPTKPLTPGQRVEIDRDSRIYVGAWTRLAVRPATPSEQAGNG